MLTLFEVDVDALVEVLVLTDVVGLELTEVDVEVLVLVLVEVDVDAL